MAPCTRSRSRASIDRAELDSDAREIEKKGLGGLPPNPPKPVTRASKRLRKDELAVDDSKKQGARGEDVQRLRMRFFWSCLKIRLF